MCTGKRAIKFEGYDTEPVPDGQKMDFGDMWGHGGVEDGGGGAMKKVQVERVERRAQGVNSVAKSERYSVSGSSAHGPHSGKRSTQTAQL